MVSQKKPQPGQGVSQLLIGRPLETQALSHQTVSKPIGLAVFASDALSSTAYATEEILIILALAGQAAKLLDARSMGHPWRAIHIATNPERAQLDENPDSFVHIIMGHLVMDSFWGQALHQNSALILNVALAGLDRVAFTQIPYQIHGGEPFNVATTN
jgi:hypothetical protein